MNSKRKRKLKKRSKKLKVNDEEYSTSYDIESSSFLNHKKPSKNKKNIQNIQNIPNKSYRKLFRVILFSIILFIMLFFFKPSKNKNKYKPDSEISLNNPTLVNLQSNVSKIELKNKNKSVESQIIPNNKMTNYSRVVKVVDITDSNTDYKHFITNEKIFWKNNKELNYTMINEEISSFENITPQFKNKEELYQREKPKVSLIIPVYKQERFVKKIYACIEQQSLKDIEIVFIDDCSPDNSFQLIKELMEIDKRIVYIKNEKNRGGFYSRNIGVIKSRGEYIFCLDIDDYLLNDILIKAYTTATKYDLDILQFYVMAGDLKKNILWRVKYRSGIIRGNSEVKKVYFNGNGRNTWDKLIRREVFIKSIDFMNDKFKSDRFNVFNDDTACFGLYKVAESYGFLEEIGYIYNWDVQGSETHRYKEPGLANLIFKSCFTIMEYFYEQTENNQYEKKAAYGFYNGKALRVLPNLLNYLSEGFDYIFKVIDIFLNSEYYTQSQKNNLKSFKEKIITQKEKVEKNKNNFNISLTIK